MKYTIARLLRWYQRTISPDHGIISLTRPYGGCRFYPSCSEYARQVILRDGTLRGGWKSVKRILKCNPLHEGGIDEI